MRHVLLGVLLLAGSGCLPAAGDAPSQPSVPVRAVPLLEGRIVVQSPEGYCVDTASLKDQARSGFVLLAGCDGLMGLPSGTLVRPAILTVSALLSRQGPNAQDDIAEAFEPQQILSRSSQGDLTVLHVQNADLVPEGSDSRHWRGNMVVNGAVLTIAVYGEGPIAKDAGKALLIKMAQLMRAASAKVAPNTSSE